MTADELRRILRYDPQTGLFFWRERVAQKIHVGDQAGTQVTGKSGVSYICITINGKRYLAHRLAWLYAYGAWPEAALDHINRDGTQNALSNLREATASQNGMNRGATKANKSGLKGASWNKFAKKWKSTIRVNGKNIHLGNFDTALAAHQAYVAAAPRLHGEFSSAA